VRDVECPYCGASVRSPEPFLLDGEAGVSVPSDQKYRETCPEGHSFWVVYRRPPSERPDVDGDGDESGGRSGGTVEGGAGAGKTG
jgi:hypothetical protein